MQTFQLLRVGVGTAVTLGLSSSAVWGSPPAIGPTMASQPQSPQAVRSDLRTLPLGQPSPTAPGTLGAMQFLTTRNTVSVKPFTALITPLLDQPLPTPGVTLSSALPPFASPLADPTPQSRSMLFATIAVSEPANPVNPATQVFPAADAAQAGTDEPRRKHPGTVDADAPINPVAPPVAATEVGIQAEATVQERRDAIRPGRRYAIAAATTEPATTAPESAAPESATPESTAPESAAPESAAPESAALESTASESAAPESTAQAVSTQAAPTPAETVLETTAVDTPDTPGTPDIPAEPSLAAAADQPEIAETDRADGTSNPVVDATAAAGGETRSPAEAETETETIPAIAEGEETPNTAADRPEREETLPAPAQPASLTAEGTPPASPPQTEIPEARDLQEAQVGERAETINPKAVSVNEPTDSQGPLPELNPNPDRLYLPDTPEEVQIQLTQPITLRQAVEQALSNNLTLQDTQLRLDRSRAQLREAQAAWHPTVSLQGAFQRADSSSTERTNRIRAQNASPLNNLLGNSDPVNRLLTGVVRLDWDVFTSGRRMANIRAAKQQVRISELEVTRQTDIVILDISNSYFDLQEADAQVRIAEAAVNSAQQSLRDTQLQFQAGVGTRFDVLQAEVQLANEKQNLTNRLAQQQIARRQLSQQLNVPQTVNLLTTSTVQVAGTWTIPLEETIIQAYENRPGLEQRLAERELRRQQRRAELAATLPQLRAFADYDVLKDLDDGIGLTDGNTVGVRLDWRLYDGGAARARARQRAIEAEIAEVGFADIRNQIRFEVERAYSNLLSNLENIDTAKVAVTQAEEALRLARLRFQAGVGTQTDVINSETDLTDARGNLLQAVINYNRSLATLERAVSLPIAESQSINEGSGTPINGGGSGS